MTQAELEQILYQALDNKIGMVVATSDSEKLKQKFYQIRSQARSNGKTAFDNLTFKTSPTNPIGELWLIKKERDNAS